MQAAILGESQRNGATGRILVDLEAVEVIPAEVAGQRRMFGGVTPRTGRAPCMAPPKGQEHSGQMATGGSESRRGHTRGVVFPKGSSVALPGMPVTPVLQEAYHLRRLARRQRGTHSSRIPGGPNCPLLSHFNPSTTLVVAGSIPCDMAGI